MGSLRFTVPVGKNVGHSILMSHEKLIEFAKYRLADSEKNINEVAYALGFDYPQHFTRFFKKYVGCSPTEYRQRRR